MFNKFDVTTVQVVWNKAVSVPGFDPNRLRKDACGAWISWEKYGDRSDQNNMGWEIDHVIPVSIGGSDDPSNLMPLHWYNNASKQDGRLTCPVRAK